MKADVYKDYKIEYKKANIDYQKTKKDVYKGYKIKVDTNDPKSLFNRLLKSISQALPEGREKTSIEKPEVQKVEVINNSKIPTVQKVEIVNAKEPKEIQKVEVLNPSKAPEIQKVEVLNAQKLPEVQKVEVLNPQKVEIPIGEGNIAGKADPEKYVPVRLTNGKKFYSALEDAYVSASKSAFPYVDKNGKPKQAIINDTGSISAMDEWGINGVDNSGGTVIYVGKESSTGEWWIMKIDSTGGFPVMTHATKNNNAYANYSTAWTNRLTLSYGNYSVAF